MLVDSFSSKDIFVSHGGSLYGERPSLIQKFNSLGVPVTVANNVSYNQLLDVWNRSKFSLSFTKASDGQFRQKKGRIGEIGYYSVVVSEPFPNIEEYYENDKEFILFNSVEEAVEKIKYYNSNEKEYNRLLLNSRNRLWNTNTAFHQWDELMSKIDEDYIRKDINKILNGYKQPL
jgi:spore maturation protein CgeB